MNELQAELERFRRDAQYYEDQLHELVEKYPERWIAILNEQVVGTSRDYDDLLRQLQENGIALERIFIELLTRQEEVFILYS